jgi:hypothetical protein
MATLRIKKRKNATKTIDIGIDTQAKDRIAVNREIAVSATTKVITLNEIIETPAIVKMEVTVVTQQADPALTTAMGKEIKTETEMECIQTRWTQTRQSKQRQQQCTMQIQHPLPRAMQRK